MALWCMETMQTSKSQNQLHSKQFSYQEQTKWTTLPLMQRPLRQNLALHILKYRGAAAGKLAHCSGTLALQHAFIAPALTMHTCRATRGFIAAS